MADKRIPWYEIESIICTETGLDSSELTKENLNKINPALIKALNLSKNTRNPNPFISEWESIQFQKETAEREKFLNSELFQNARNQVISGLSNISYRFIEGEDFEENEEIVKICTGWITTGEYNDNLFSYFTKTKEEGVSKLTDFIAQSVLNNTHNSDMFSAFIDSTVSNKNKYTFVDKKGTQEWIKEVCNVANV